MYIYKDSRRNKSIILILKDLFSITQINNRSIKIYNEIQ